MATTIDLTRGSAEAFPPALVATATGVLGSESVVIECGFMPARVTIILDGTADMLLEFILGMSGYFKCATGTAGIEAGDLVVADDLGFAIDSTLEGAGTYHIIAWR